MTGLSGRALAPGRAGHPRAAPSDRETRRGVLLVGDQRTVLSNGREDMRRRWRSGRRGGSGSLLGVAVLAVVVGVPTAAGGQGAADGGESSVRETPDLVYDCETEAGQRQLRARVGMSLPGSGSVSTPIEPGGVTVEMTLPKPVVGELAGSGVSSVTGQAMLDVRLADRELSAGSGPRIVRFPGLTVAPTPLPQDSAVTLTATGEGPEITPAAAGELAVSAGRINLLLTSDRSGAEPGAGEGAGTDGETGGDDGDNATGDSSTAPGTAPGTDSGEDGEAAPAATDEPGDGAPAIPAFDCVPAPDQDTVIGTVTVDGEGPATPDRSPEAGVGEPDALPDSGDGGDVAAAQQGEVPEDCVDFADKNNAWCAYMGGYTNIKKLGAATRIDPGIVNIALPVAAPCDDGSEWYWFCMDAAALLQHNGTQQLPPTRNSFHAFDFMPNSATVRLTQVGAMDLVVRMRIDGAEGGSVVAHANLLLQLEDVSVNGERLEVGPECRTEEPLEVQLTADYPGDYTPTNGGFLDGYVRIPPFAGCGVDENLDPLLTGLISGPDNYVKMTQGQICSIRSASDCPPSPPELVR